MAKRSGYRGYITSRAFLGERAPQHIQNLVIRDYARRMDIEYLLSATEYAMEGSHLILQQVLDELPRLQGVICYSIFQMPENPTVRQAAYQRVIESGAELHTAVEGLVIRAVGDIDGIEDIWRVRRALGDCPTADAVAAAI